MLHAIAGGLFAGLVFAVGQVLIALALGYSGAAPAELAASMLLPGSAPDSIATTVVAAAIVHATLSMLFALLFLNVTRSLWQAGAGVPSMLLLGISWGTGLWLVNIQVIAPLALPQFQEISQLWSGFFAHAFLYGGVLGLYAGAVPIRDVPRSSAREVSAY